MALDAFSTFIQIFEWFFEAVGTTIIIFAGLKATAQLFMLEVFKKPYRMETIRNELTTKILFGLEFYIVVAVLATLRNPSREDLLVLGAVILIRTILGYFLSKEVKEYRFD
ncbi:MAG: DUF1622 domain-containing protein [Methanosarcina sp.]